MRSSSESSSLDSQPIVYGDIPMKAVLWSVVVVIACGPGPRREERGGDDTQIGGSCLRECSGDLHAVTDCNGNVLEACPTGLACDPTTFTCADPCRAAEANHRSVGCDYYATQMELLTQRVPLTAGYCFAVFVANTWATP